MEAEPWIRPLSARRRHSREIGYQTAILGPSGKWSIELTTGDTSKPISSGVQSLFSAVQRHSEAAGVFGPISIKGGRLVCQAKASAEPASYRLEVDGGRLWVSLVTANRWLSESVEADLMHTGDKVEELLDEELVEQGLPPLAKPGKHVVEHFRSDDMLFTFRSPLPIDLNKADTPAAARTAGQWLLAYEACFRNLGDMNAGGAGE
jgi:hypothetical protein